MARDLMPKTGILMPYVVVNRDAQIVGVNSVDGQSGDIDLTAKYLTVASASTQYMLKNESYNRSQLDARYLAIAKPRVAYNKAYFSTGATGTNAAEIELIKASDFTTIQDTNGQGTIGTVTKNNIIIGDLDSGVSGVHIYSEGRTDVIYTNDAGDQRTAPLYSQRYRPEIADMPFAVIGDYVKDSKGRTIGVNKSAGVNNDIKQLNGITQIGVDSDNTAVLVKKPMTFQKAITIPDAANDSQPVTLRQLKANSGGSGGASLNGVMNNFIGAVEWFNGTIAKLPAGYLPADGRIVKRTDYPDLWAAVSIQMFNAVSEADWVNSKVTNYPWSNRSKYSTGDGNFTTGTTFRLPDLNGVQTSGGISTVNGIFLSNNPKGAGLYGQSAPNITGNVSGASHGSFAQIFLKSPVAGAFSADNSSFPTGVGDEIPPVTDPRPPVEASRVNTLHLDASKSEGTYGRDGIRLYPNTASGIWIIRVSGVFQSAKTEFDVITANTNPPPAGTAVHGGMIRSTYETGGKTRVSAGMYANFPWGGAASAGSNNIDVVTYNADGSIAANATFLCRADGAFVAPNNLSAGYGTYSGGKYASGSIQGAFMVMAPDGNSAPGLYVRSKTGEAAGYSGSFLYDETSRSWTTGNNIHCDGQQIQVNVPNMGYNQLWSAAGVRLNAWTASNGAENFQSFIAGRAMTQGLGFDGGVSYGMMTPGNNAWPKAQISIATHDYNEASGHGSQTAYRFDGDGNISMSAPTAAWVLTYNGDIGGAVWQVPGSGNSLSSFITWKIANPSDIKFKDNIIDAETGSLDRILKIKPREFVWKENNKKARGYIAQELEKVDPLYVNEIEVEDHDNYKGVNQNAIVADLISAIQVLTKRVEELEAKSEVK